MQYLKSSKDVGSTEARDDKLAISSVKGDLARKMFVGFMRGCASPRDSAVKNTDKATPFHNGH